jgi:hypothetical protein
MYRGVWPSTGRGAEGINVPVDVHLVLEGSLDKERSACRSLYLLITFRFPTYLASYDTAPSVLPMEAAHPVVPIEELTRSSSPASMLPVALSEVLGISLSEVMDQYFDGSEESERVRRIEEALDRRREFEEGEEWLARESRKTDAILERIHWVKMTIHSEYKGRLLNNRDLLFCVIVSVSVKAVTGMRVEKQKGGYITFITIPQPPASSDSGAVAHHS